MYLKKPEMILFDVGGTLFIDGKCIPRDGLSELRKLAENPDITDDNTLLALWDEYMDEVDVGLCSKNGAVLDIPLSVVLKYIIMKSGLRINLPMYDIEEIFDRYNSSRAVAEGLTGLLDVIKSKGIRAAVISNNAMSGESLFLSIKRWIPSSHFEFCLTSADILLAKPCRQIFSIAASFAGLKPSDCWYCGDGFRPDVYGALKAGMHPVLIDRSADNSLTFRTYEGMGEYMVINHWDKLSEYINNLQD